jgi:aminopeptidase N
VTARPTAPTGEQIGRRALSGSPSTTGDGARGDGVGRWPRRVYREADNLTERLLTLCAACSERHDEVYEAALAISLERFGDETLAVNHWLQVQAESPRGDAVARVRDADGAPGLRSPATRTRSAPWSAPLPTSMPWPFIARTAPATRCSGEVIEELNERNPQIAARAADAPDALASLPVAAATPCARNSSAWPRCRPCPATSTR